MLPCPISACLEAESIYETSSKLERKFRLIWSSSLIHRKCPESGRLWKEECLALLRMEADKPVGASGAVAFESGIRSW